MKAKLLMPLAYEALQCKFGRMLWVIACIQALRDRPLKPICLETARCLLIDAQCQQDIFQQSNCVLVVLPSQLMRRFVNYSSLLVDSIKLQVET